jgi:hypothetical protein
MNAYIIVKKSDGTQLRENSILSFRFIKDAYLPYTHLSVRVRSTSASFADAAELLLYVGGHNVHHGLIDSLTVTNAGGYSITSVVSRGFTSLLCQNQTEPGMKTGVSINSLMDSYYTFPYVTHENNSDASNYIFVKNNSSMWDGIVNLSYKLCGTYPYIRGTNCVRITPESSPQQFTYQSSGLITSGTELTYRRMISGFHMSDINGDYGNYDLIDPDVTAKKIVRHEFFELDRQFLSDPQQALVFRDKYTARAAERTFCSYCGYNGEDLSDTATFGDVTGRRITALEINGSHKGIFTEVSTYRDKFYT